MVPRGISRWGIAGAALQLCTNGMGVVDALRVTQAERKAERANPALEPYLKRTEQYLEDAKIANAAAQHYRDLAKAALPQLAEKTKAATTAELARIGIKPWAAAVWHVDKMLYNDKPGKAAAAAAAAAAPFEKARVDYETSMIAYDEAAQLYAIEVQEEVKLANQLQAYANQYKLEGNHEMADNYHKQATLMMEQAHSYEGVAKDYNYMALKLQAAQPQVAMEGEAAAKAAAFKEDPGNSIPPENVHAFTVAPPFPEDVTTMV